MIDVIMRDGRVLRYNRANAIEYHGDFIELAVSRNVTSFLAIFPRDSIERIDGDKPCRVLYESRDKKKRKRY